MTDFQNSTDPDARLTVDPLVRRIVGDLRTLSDDDRLEVFSHFCKFCGCDNPKCQCWNDD